MSFHGKIRIAWKTMGALEFLPETARGGKAEKIDLKSLTDLTERIFSERENVRIMPEESITMQSLLTVGTSAGGRQPKAMFQKLQVGSFPALLKKRKTVTAKMRLSFR